MHKNIERGLFFFPGVIGSFHHYFPSQLLGEKAGYLPLVVMRKSLPPISLSHLEATFALSYLMPFQFAPKRGTWHCNIISNATLTFPCHSIPHTTWNIHTIPCPRHRFSSQEDVVQVNTSGRIVWSLGLRTCHKVATESSTLIFTLYFMVVGTQDTSNKVSNGNVMPLSFCALPFRNMSVNNSSLQRPGWKS